MLLENYIDNFLTYLASQRRYSPRTITTYKKSLEKFKQALPEKAPLESFTELSVKSFVWDLKMKQRLAPASICEHLAALKSFGKYLVRSSFIAKNPTLNVPMPKRPQRLVAFLSQKDLAEDKFPELENTTLAQIRARVLLELIYGSGLRISECQSLCWNQIGNSQKLVRVIGKGNKERIVPITDQLLDKLTIFKQMLKRRKNSSSIKSGILKRRRKTLQHSHPTKRHSRFAKKHRMGRKSKPPRTASQLCNPLTRKWSRNHECEGNAWAFQHFYNANLHPRKRRTPSRSIQKNAPESVTRSKAARQLTMNN